jgi:biopolymer transport protein ExbD
MIQAFGGRRFADARRSSASINVTPLVDVMFQLLIFLLVTTSFKIAPGIKVDLPRAPHAGPSRVERLLLTVSRDGAYHLDNTWVAPGDLGPRLRNLRERMGDRPLALRVDREARSGALVLALDAARDAGYKQVVLPTETPRGRSTDGGGGEARAGPGPDGPVPDRR